MEILQLYGGATINNSQISGQVNAGAFGTKDIILYNGEIDQVHLLNGGNCIINGGIVSKIRLGNNAGNINLTIGNINENVNNNDPQIKEIQVETGDLAGITAIINFYNGIIQKGYYGDDDSGYYGEFNLRPGYKAQTTADGTILVKQ